MDSNVLDKAAKRLKCLAIFTFFISPLFAWGSVISSDETAVFASLSRMIWYSGDAFRIMIAMLVMFLPMIISFFLAQSLNEMPKAQKLACRVSMIVSCIVLYIGFGGIFMIFLTFCLYTYMIRRTDRDGAGLLAAFLVFTLITSAFAVLNVFDDKSYVIASAVSELYVLIMLSLIGYLTYYLAYRRAKYIINKDENYEK